MITRCEEDALQNVTISLFVAQWRELGLYGTFVAIAFFAFLRGILEVKLELI